MLVTPYDTAVRGDGQWQTLCVFDDEAGGVTKEYVIYAPGADATAALTERVRAQLAQATRAAKPPAFPRVGTVLDLSVPAAVVVAPTQAELDRAKWFAAYLAMQQYGRGVANGFPGFDQGTLDAKRADLGRLFDPSYVGLL